MKKLNLNLKRFVQLKQLQSLVSLRGLKKIKNFKNSVKLGDFTSLTAIIDNKIALAICAVGVVALVAMCTIFVASGSQQPKTVASALPTDVEVSAIATPDSGDSVEILDLTEDIPSADPMKAPMPTGATPTRQQPTAPAAAAATPAPTTTKVIALNTTEASLPFDIIEVEEPDPQPTAQKQNNSNHLEVLDLHSGTASTSVEKSNLKSDKKADPEIDPEQAKRIAAAEEKKTRYYNRIEATLMKHPEQEEKARKYGALLTQAGEYERGERFYLWYLTTHPQDAEAFYGLGWHYEQAKQWRKACKTYQRAADLDAKHFMARNNLAWILSTSPDASVRDGARAIVLAKEANGLLEWPRPGIAETLAAAYAEAGDFRAAIRVEKWAIRSAPAADKPAMMQKLELYRSKQPFRSE